MATKSTLPDPLALAKSDTPRNAIAKTAMLATVKTLTRTLRPVAKIGGRARIEFWEALGAYCRRKLAETESAGVQPAAGGTPAKTPGKAGKPRKAGA